MKIRYRNLSVKNPALKKELLDAVGKVLDHGFLLLGPEHTVFEKELAQYCGTKYGIGMSSGTDALFLGLKALGIGPGDEVIVTALSWIATLNAIILNGATPVFVDVDESLNLNVDLVEAAITRKTKAILPVHFTGAMCDIERLVQIANKYKVYLIEDGAQAFGASINGKKCGAFGTLSCFSLNPMKVLNAYGEAGAVLTNDEELKDRLVSLRYNGTIGRQDCHYPSLNGRLDTIQAALLSISLKYLPEKIARRRVLASAYTNRLSEVVKCPVEKEGYQSIYYSYSILAERRDELMAFLIEKGIETQIQHPLTMANHTAYKGKFITNTPVAEKLVRQILCLPVQENLSLEELEYVCDNIKLFYKS